MMENDRTDIEKDMNAAMDKWHAHTERMIREIIKRENIPHNQLHFRLKVKILPDNVKEYYLDGRMILITKIITEKNLSTKQKAFAEERVKALTKSDEKL